MAAVVTPAMIAAGLAGPVSTVAYPGGSVALLTSSIPAVSSGVSATAATGYGAMALGGLAAGAGIATGGVAAGLRLQCNPQKREKIIKGMCVGVTKNKAQCEQFVSRVKPDKNICKKQYNKGGYSR